MDSQGGETEGVLDAATQTEAVSQIRGKGLFPTRVVEMNGAAGGGKRERRTKKKTAKAPSSQGLQKEIKLPSFLRPRVKTKHLMVLTRQLATLVEAGLPLLRGLRILRQQEKHPSLREALDGMSESVEGGSTFSESLTIFPKVFDMLFINMVRAGEAGGILDKVLVRLAEFMEKAERIKRRVKGAMVYPIVVLVVAVGILVFLMVEIIPKFAVIFEDLTGEAGLPALTQAVINVSDFMKHRWYWIVAGVAVIVILFKVLRKTRFGNKLLDGINLKLPLFGTLFVKSAVSRFSRTLGTLMASGVPVLQALNIVRDTSGNAVIADAIQDVHDSVKEGDTMAMPLEAAKVFPSMVVSMVDVGEETGALPEMLIRIADNYEDEVDTAVEGLTSIIEPVMIVLLAFIVGIIVIAMFVPLIDIIGKM
jgi:type IV pilus assembly protein PilC